MPDSARKKDTFFGGAAILAAGIIIVKIIGALYKIPLGSILSDAAYADFNTAYYIYSLLIVISTGGLPVALSKMVSEANATGRDNQVQKVFRIAMVAFCVLGAITSAVMFFFPRQLADFMNNTHSYYSILALAPALFFICPLSAMRGYFQGHSLMTPTAVSEIIEAACKLLFGLPLAWIIVSRGMDESIAAGGAIVGVTIGCFLAAVFMLFMYRAYRSHVSASSDTPDAGRDILRTLMALAIPITLGSSVMAVANLIDAKLLLGRLQDAVGLTEDAARELRGVYDKAVTLYNLPTQFMVPLTASVIPAVSAAIAVKNYKQGALVSETALRTTALLAIPAGVGLSVLGQPIIRLLFPNTDVALGGWMLSVLGFAAIAVCLMLVCNSILQAYKLANVTMITTIIGCVVKVLINYFLVANPAINIRGAAFSTLGCFGLVALLDLIIIKLMLPQSPGYLRVFIKPVLNSAVMGLAVWAMYGLSSKLLAGVGPFGSEGALTNLGNAACVVIAIGVGIIVYFALVLLTRAISKDDLSLMPKGDKIAKILRLN